MGSKKHGLRIAVLSGKGGTGKTLVSTNLAALKKGNTYVDCDVEEPNGHLYFPMKKPTVTQVFSDIPEVDPVRCDGCRACVDFCRFQSMAFIAGKVKIFQDVCHSCGGCKLVCPQNAITYKRSIVGSVSAGRYEGIHIYSGMMEIGKASGVPIIKDLLEESKTQRGLVVTDCPPGSACIVMESIKNADYCVMVAEPTVFGAHNLEMIHKLVSIFQIPYGVVLNKCGKGENPSETYCRENGIPIIGRLDFDHELGRLNSNGRISVWENHGYRKSFEEIHKNILAEVEG